MFPNTDKHLAQAIHDLKQPLNAICLSVGSARHYLRDVQAFENVARISAKLNAIESQVERMGRLIDELAGKGQ